MNLGRQGVLDKRGDRAGRQGALDGEIGTFPSLTEGESVSNLQQTGLGIDRLSFSVPVADAAPPSAWDRCEYRWSDGRQTMAAMVHPHRDRVTSRPIGPGVMVGVQTVDGVPWAKAEANPSRFWDPDGCGLLPPSMLAAAAETMWAALCELVTPGCSADAARVKRVDVARDFRGITAPSMYIEGLGPIKRPYARRSFTYNDPQRANAQTLFVGSKAGGVRLYDQHAAYAEKGAPEGSLRWEGEVRGGWLDRAGLRHLGDVDAVSMDRLARDRWEWSGMGQTVSGPVHAVQVVERAVQEGRVSAAVAERALGRMMLESFGVRRELDRVTAWRHQGVMRELGLMHDSLWSNDLSAQASGRLDFESGTEELSLSAGV